MYFPTPDTEKHKKAANKILSRVEEKLGIGLPSDYRKFVLELETYLEYLDEAEELSMFQYRLSRDNNNYPLNYQYKMPDNKGHAYISDLYFMRNFLRDDVKKDIAWKLVEDYLLPFASTGTGDNICIYIKGPRRGKIYMWNHENERVDLIADSFTEFIKGLKKRTN